MKLITSTCDMSGCTNSKRKVLVVEHSHHGTPVLNQCRYCDPIGWQMAAENQKEEWLRGE
jgi:hypothetical protein